MAVVARPFPPTLAHGELREVLPDLFLVSGAVFLPGPLPIRFSRNMIVVRDGERLVVVNSMRLGDAGLAALDKLGKVTDVIRLAANHGMDDPFYADRYKAKVWAVKGQRYTAGFDTKSETTYFEPSIEMDATTTLPIDGAKLHVIHSEPPEAIVVLSRHDGTVICGDCLQNWVTADEHFNWLARPMMKVMGFIKPHNVGPGWLRQCKPPKDELRAILDFKFENVFPAHGAPVVGKGATLFRTAIEKASATATND